jgi:hypothetical protein
MPQHTDRDGKSKTSSAVDAEHYPEPNAESGTPAAPNAEQIERRAQELRRARAGGGDITAEDRREAERELKEKLNAQNPAATVPESGSVQR